MSKHTAGKWINRTAGDVTDENGGQIYAGKLHLATCHYGNGIDCDEKAANARLIAAAPELLSALKWMTDEFLCHVNFNPAGGDADAFHAYLNQARLVIQEAEGRE